MQGKRVQVLGNDGSAPPEEGTFVGNVTVYIRRNEDGTISSQDDAEEKPEGEGWEEIGENPKIVLDSGKIVYGCQVWWEPVPSLEIAIVLPTGMAEILNENGDKVEDGLYLGTVEVLVRSNAAAIACGNDPKASISPERPEGEGWQLLDAQPRIVLKNGEVVIHDTVRFRLGEMTD